MIPSDVPIYEHVFLFLLTYMPRSLYLLDEKGVEPLGQYLCTELQCKRSSVLNSRNPFNKSIVPIYDTPRGTSQA